MTATGAGVLAAGLTFASAAAVRAAVREGRRSAASRRLPTAARTAHGGLPAGFAPHRDGGAPDGRRGAFAPLRDGGAPDGRRSVSTPRWAGRNPVGGRSPAAAAARAALGRRLDEAGVVADPATVVRSWLGAGGLAVAIALVAAGPGAATLAGVLAAAGPCLGWRLVRHRGAARLEAGLPAAVEAVAGGLRSGASLRQALGVAAGAVTGPLAGDLAVVAAATERGAGLVASLDRWAERRPVPGVRLVVAALCLGAETGGAAAQAVDGVALTLRQRLAAQAEAKALATQARVSAVVIGASPVVFCTLAAATDARTAELLLRTPLGLTLLAAGLALDGAGALWMARLTRVEP